jgi:beta-xylosidase
MSIAAALRMRARLGPGSSSKLIAAAALILLAGSAPAQEVASVLDGGDPDAVAIDGRIWIYPTRTGTQLKTWASRDLVHWDEQGTLLRQEDIGWIGADGAPRHSLWAPHMLAARGRYYLYYSVGPQNPTASRLGVAICTGPAGPCKDSGRPLLTGGGGFEAIDPAVFHDRKSGRTYLYAGGSAGATLRVFRLKRDLLSIDREVRIDQPPLFTEGAFLHERRGIYYLSYSHGRWNDATYSVHYATSRSPVGPWHYRGVLLRSDAKYKGPGHHSFVRDPRSSRDLIVYHRWEGKSDAGPYKGTRRIVLQPVTYTRDGLIAPIEMSR